MNLPIYLDYASTTPVHDSVIEAMNLYLTKEFGNSGSQQHIYGWKAEEAIEASRSKISNYFKVNNKQIVFTSGATESNNIAIQGYLRNFNKPGHLITSQTEHKSVIEVFKEYEKLGWEVTYLKPNEFGVLDLIEIENSFKENTRLISIMWVNNETGYIQPIEQIKEIAEQKQVIFHSDATQALGKLDLPKFALPDLLSFSAHKIYGPKGIGGLVINNEKIKLYPLIFGGNQERGLRSGTLPTQQIVGMSKAFDLIPDLLEKRIFYSEWKGKIESLLVNSFNNNIIIHSTQEGVPSILNFSCSKIDWEELFLMLSSIAISNGSACNARSKNPSHVLKAMGLSDDLSLASVRLSMGFMNTAEEMEFVLSYLEKQLGSYYERMG